MAKTTVTVNFDITKLLPKFIDSKTEFLIGDAVTEMSKDMISKGVSPVRGERRFDAYVAQGRTQEAKKNLSGAKKAAKNIKSKSATKAVSHAKGALSQARSGYPYSVMNQYPDKKVRPVNLFLSGKMLSYLGWRRKSESVIECGIIDAPPEINTIAKVHNDGERNDIPQRPFVPNKPNQTYAVTILRKVLDIFQKRMDEVIERSNQK